MTPSDNSFRGLRLLSSVECVGHAFDDLPLAVDPRNRKRLAPARAATYPSSRRNSRTDSHTARASSPSTVTTAGPRK